MSPVLPGRVLDIEAPGALPSRLHCCNQITGAAGGVPASGAMQVAVP